MHVIIDGYNLLGFAGRMGSVGGPGSGVSEMEDARELLLRQLALYRQRKTHAVTVVFDGWRRGMTAERHEHRSGVEVIYSRRGETADAVIQRLAEEYGREAAVVSSDRQVADHAKAQGAFVISAAEFAESLAAGLSSATPSEAGQPGRPRWAARQDHDDEPSVRTQQKKGNPRKLPKRLRQRRQRLRGF